MDREIYLVGLNHRTAGVEVREAFALADIRLLEEGLLPVSGLSLSAFSGPDLSGAAGPAPVDEPDEDVSSVAPVVPVVKEALVLSTCNRVEIIAVGNPPATNGQPSVEEEVIACWAAARGKKAEDLRPYVYCHRGQEAVRHLFTVASSLDSMILGEPQILGQLKTAYKKSLDIGATKVILNRLLHRAFSVAKRVRSETGVASSAVSISYAAVELAKRIFGDMAPYKAMLIGAGEMAELAATHLLNSGIKSVWVANRTHERAIELSAEWGGVAVPFESLFNQLHEVDIVISSTGAPEAIISAKDMGAVMRRRKNRPMFFIDIAVPRDIDPDVNGLDNIYLYDIDDLKEVVEENLAQRQEEAVKARRIVEEEGQAFMKWQDSLQLQPTIIDLIKRTESIAQEEFERTLRRLDIDEQTEAALRAMLRSMAKKLNHKPITFLKRRHAEEKAGAGYLGLVRRLFDLDLDNDKIPPDAHADRKNKS